MIGESLKVPVASGADGCFNLWIMAPVMFNIDDLVKYVGCPRRDHPRSLNKSVMSIHNQRIVRCVDHLMIMWLIDNNIRMVRILLTAISLMRAAPMLCSNPNTCTPCIYIHGVFHSRLFTSDHFLIISLCSSNCSTP